MDVDAFELLTTIEASLGIHLPLSESLDDCATAHDHGAPLTLGPYKAGDTLDWRGAWEAMRHPEYVAGWQVAPLSGGRLVLALRDGLSPRQVAAADAWQQRAVGVFAVLAGMGSATSRS